MAKYKIKNTDILKDGKVHANGSEIELDKKDADILADFLIPVQEKSNANKSTKNDTKTENKANSKTEDKKSDDENKTEDTKNDGGSK